MKMILQAGIINMDTFLAEQIQHTNAQANPLDEDFDMCYRLLGWVYSEINQ